MKNIISAFTTLFFYLLCVFGAAALLTASAQTAAAKEYKADVIAEIENSDFNRDVISSCISQAQSAGYTLTVTPSANAEGETVSADVIPVSYTHILQCRSDHLHIIPSVYLTFVLRLLCLSRRKNVFFSQPVFPSRA